MLINQKVDTRNGADLALVVASLQQRSKTLVEMSEGLKMFYQDSRACSIQILNCTKGLLSKSALEIPLLVNSRLNLIKSTFIINCFCQTL
jgi:uncharacterized phage-like protein YoqJ